MKLRNLIGLIVFLSATANSATTITSISGNASYGSQLTINGSSFGSKPNQAKTLLYANFEFDVNPSSWGATTSWTDLAHGQRATTTCEEGSGCLGETSGWDTTVSPNKVTAAIDLGSPVAASGKIYEGWDWQSDAQDVGTTANLKSHRRWASGFKLNDLYGAQQCDSGYEEFTENDDGTVNSTTRNFTTRFVANHSAFTQAIVQEQENSAAGSANGIMNKYLDGVQFANWTNWNSFTTADAGNGRYQLFYPIHYEFTSGGSCSPNPTVSVPINDGSHPHYVRYDNVIVENSWCIVWYSTASTESAGVKRFYCPVVSWSTTQIVIVCTNKIVTAGGHMYFHVMENGGTFNATGFDVTSQQSNGSAAPTGSSISPATCTTAGGDTITFNGANIVNGATVMVGTTTANSVIFVNSGQVTFVSPGLAVGTFDVTLANPDAQSVTLSGVLTSVAPPSGVIPTAKLPWRKL